MQGRCASTGRAPEEVNHDPDPPAIRAWSLMAASSCCWSSPVVASVAQSSAPTDPSPFTTFGSATLGALAEDEG
jgi:hypothetical protein